MTADTIETALAEFASNLRLEDVTPSAIAKAKTLIVDGMRAGRRLE
jgi:2-methylcitrate dehydratase PrpD